MSAAPKSYIPVPVSRSKRPRPSSPRVERSVTPSLDQPSTSIRSVNPSPPKRLHTLSQVQKLVSVLTFSLLTTTLGLYAWTVYIPKLWDREFGKLEALQRNERHLLATNETLKHQLAEKAETAFGLPRPFQTIFLRRSPHTKITPVVAPRGQTAAILSRKAY
jgi:hypothetical protein